MTLQDRISKTKTDKCLTENGSYGWKSFSLTDVRHIVLNTVSTSGRLYEKMV